MSVASKTIIVFYSCRLTYVGYSTIEEFMVRILQMRMTAWMNAALFDLTTASGKQKPLVVDAADKSH